MKGLFVLTGFFVAIVIVGSCLVAYQASLNKLTPYPIAKFEGINPLKGFAPWASDETLDQKYSLVYANTTWREIEVSEGVFDFSAFEERNQYEHWKASHTRIVFRLALDVPRDNEHTDLPDWLMEKIGADGDTYSTEYGMGFSPNYSNPIVMEGHKKLIQAIATHFAADQLIAYIELGSLGHWGEWHIKANEGLKPMPGQAIRETYVGHYLDVFPHAMLLMRRPFAIANGERLGLFNDMMGHKQATDTWLGWINEGGEYDQTGESAALSAMPDGWKYAPIGGEMTHSIPARQIYLTDLETTLKQVEASHATFIGPGGYENPENDRQISIGQAMITGRLGYAFHIQSAILPSRLFLGDTLKGEVRLRNVGIAPFYQNWPMQVKVTNELGQATTVLLEQPQLTQLLPETTLVIPFEVPLGLMEDGKCQIFFSIIDPLTGKPAVGFLNEPTGSAQQFLLGETILQRPIRVFMGWLSGIARQK